MAVKVMTDTGMAIRAALAEKAEAGNTSFIHEKDVLKHGGNAPQWQEYDDTLTRMEVLARKFVLHYYGVLKGKDASELDEAGIRRDDELKKINSELINLKKDLLSWVDPEQKHRCSYVDGVVIGEMAHDIISQKNNVEGEKGFKSRSAHTYASRRVFRHRLEANLGILITGADVIEPEHAHYLRVEKQLVGKVRGAEKAVKEFQEQRATFITFATDFEIPEEQQKARLAYYDKQIESADEDVEAAKKELAQFHRDHTDKKLVEPTIQEEMGQAQKEEDKSAILEKVQAMTEEQKKEVMGLLKLKPRKGEADDALNERIAEAIMKVKELTEVEPAEEAKAEPAEAK